MTELWTSKLWKRDLWTRQLWTRYFVDKRVVLTFFLQRSYAIGCLYFKFLYNQVEAQVCNVLDFVILRTIHESMCTDSRISEIFPIIYKAHGWVICGWWFLDECIVDEFLVDSVSWMVSREQCIVDGFFVDGFFVDSMLGSSWMNVSWKV